MAKRISPCQAANCPLLLTHWVSAASIRAAPDARVRSSASPRGTQLRRLLERSGVLHRFRTPSGASRRARRSRMSMSPLNKGGTTDLYAGGGFLPCRFFLYLVLLKRCD
jgi:hypothetical protein